MGLRDLGRRLKAARRGERPPSPPLADDGACAPPLPDLEERLARVAAKAPLFHESLTRLDPYQLSAVLTEEPVVSVRAQVGSGKTTVLAHKVIWMHRVEGIPLSDMAVLTFTRKAAGEMADRVRELCGDVQPGDFRYFGTFHAVAAALLRQEGAGAASGRSPRFSILDEAERLALLEDLVEREGLSIKYRARLAMRMQALAAGRPRVGAMRSTDDIAILEERYEEEKRRRDLFDFDDLIVWATKAVEEGAGFRPRWVAVDEFQDCDPTQLAQLRAFMGGGAAGDDEDRKLFVVGDPHQLVYAFRGGDARIFEDLEADFGARVFHLPFNYRSTDVILLASRAVLGGRCGRLTGTRTEGERIRLLRHHDPTQEALYLARRLGRFSAEERGRTAVLFRKREQALPIAEALESASIPHTVLDDGDPSTDAVRLLTLHASKGLEFDTVFLVGINDGLVPLASSFRDAEAEAEEQRLLFVGMTRARDRLEVSYLADPRDFGARPEKSRFLDLIPPGLLEEDAPEGGESLSVSGPARGACVQHPRYGRGRVVEVEDSTIRVAFDLHGMKTFSLAFGNAGLEPVAADEG